MSKPIGKYDNECPNCIMHFGEWVYDDYDSITYMCPRCGTEFTSWDKEPADLELPDIDEEW